ncbi:MAG: ABC-F family ATP-binding cassette domain-containing protein [Candidatus Dadabacteria bacterium]|nr:ABC-F family ATP-binding cassette domain-containing protein [Candidatus Dadabacteria bacterium]NIS08227.1 ABC-F family ATP-binding cassette domain-containing protein [Candidatus Dadabacteria bacterium]NIV41494.1 ATP-binding cassette domain-containing protein [Candidatus Dadabacteria bacterium]NIY21715.1 ATP-binding cassette domain-containing protein [Candidatus Dadabacteria bacterium]
MITIKDLSLSFGSDKILNSLDWHIKDGEKIGLVGPNGAGKTTLLEIITGFITPDQGSISLPSSSVVGYLPQQFHINNSDTTLVDETLTVFKDIKELEQEHESLLNELSRFKDDADQEYKALLKKLDYTQNELKTRDFETINKRAEKMLMGLGFTVNDLKSPLSTFSGGWRMRVELAKLLLKEPDFLFLDEPTNHLDIESISWLESYLKSFDGSVIVVSHDKYFLDRMTEITVELSGGKITEYQGNYSKYLELRMRNMEIQKSAYENQQRQIKQYERFIERFRYKNTKAKQVQSRIKMLGKLERVEEVESDKSVNFRFNNTKRSGKNVLEISAFSKSYGDNTVFKDSEPLNIIRGDKIALVGKNGIGKSTLIRIIKGTEEFDGQRKLGYEVELTYFAQNQAETLNPNNSVFEELANSADSKVSNETDIRTILGNFLFSGDDVFKNIKVLSGGEKSRAALAKTLLSPNNFLVLDEPTNHLDIQSRNVLIEALQSYDGTFIVVSHDRHFIDSICNKVWYIENNRVYEYLGNYSDFQYHLEKKTRNILSNEQEQISQNMEQPADSGSEDKDKKRLDAEKRNKAFKELKEKGIINFNSWNLLTKNQLSNVINDLETDIEKKENQKKELEKLLEKEETFKDLEYSNKITSELSSLDSLILILYDKWTEITKAREI